MLIGPDDHPFTESNSCGIARLIEANVQGKIKSARGSPRLDDVQDRFAHVLDAEELEEFRGAMSQALGDGSFFIGEWFHCAVGTNPG